MNSNINENFTKKTEENNNKPRTIPPFNTLKNTNEMSKSIINIPDMNLLLLDI
jgi:hypothetical protein